MTLHRAQQILKWVSESVSTATIAEYCAVEDAQDRRQNKQNAATPAFTGTLEELGQAHIEEARRVLKAEEGRAT